MKYQAPFGEADNTPYSDGDLSAGVRGSIPRAAAIEDPQRELAHLIAYFGLTPSEGDLEQVRKAIQAAIAAATGGGDTSQFLLTAQARARLPIYPEILTADGRMNVTSPGAGSVLVPPTVAFQHRGIFPLNTSNYSEAARTFATVANKTYHLRWNPANGFVLKDVADAAYNPTAAAEGSIIFDSTYDDMLVARVVTNASNVATITNLANLQQISASGETQYGGAISQIADGSAQVTMDLAFLNWARRPRFQSVMPVVGATQTSGNGLDGYANRVHSIDAGRYKVATTISSDFLTTGVSGFYAIAQWSFAV